MEQHRNAGGDGAEHFVEIGIRAAGNIDHQIARITRRLRQNVQDGGLAEAARAVQDGVQALFLDRANELGQDFGAAGETLPVSDGL